MKIDWEDSLSLGVDEIDEDHRQMVNTFNRLVEACIDARGPIEATLIVNELTGATRVHFTREEVLMADYAYPGIDAHRDEHGEFVGDLEDLERRFLAAGAPELCLGTLAEIGRKLVGHIRAADRDYIEFFHDLMQRQARARP